MTSPGTSDAPDVAFAYRNMASVSDFLAKYGYAELGAQFDWTKPWAVFERAPSGEPGETLSWHEDEVAARGAFAFLLVQAIANGVPESPEPLGKPLRFVQLLAWQAGRAAAELALSAGTPLEGKTVLPSWWATRPNWFCCNGHVSQSYSERTAGSWRKEGCPECGEPVVLGPGITAGEFLWEIERVRQASRGQATVT